MQHQRLGIPLRIKITLALFGILAITIILGALLVLNQNELLIREKHHKRLAQLIRNTAHSLTEPLLNQDDLRCYTLISEFQKELDVSEIQVIDHSIQKITASTNLHHLGQIPASPLYQKILANRDSLLVIHHRDTLVYAFPIQIRQNKLGDVVLKTSVEQERRLQQADLMPTYHTILWVSAFSLLLGISGVVFLTRQILKPLGQLMAGIERISQGDMNYRISLKTRDEFEEVARAFNRMLEIIEYKENQIIEFNKHLEKRIKEAVEHSLELEKQIAETERMASVGRLAGSIAHELNNPLASILMYARLAEEQITAPVTQRNIQKIIKNTMRARNTIRDLVDYTRYSRLEKRKTNVVGLIESLIQQVRPEAESRGIQIEWQSRSPLYAWLDARHFERVINNLIQNAFDAMPEGGTLTVTVKQSRRNVLITVTDTGTGIEAKDLKKIFEPFYSTKETGTGLGLFISYEIIRAHGGTIKATPNKPRGMIFQITLPGERQHE